MHPLLRSPRPVRIVQHPVLKGSTGIHLVHQPSWVDEAVVVHDLHGKGLCPGPRPGFRDRGSEEDFYRPAP